MMLNLWKKPKDYQYLFLDMNAYFASCEQQAHPELRGKPVVVTPTPCPTGCIITASYEARAYGIKTGWMVRDAQKACPKIIIRSSDTFLYLKYHEQFIKIISILTPFYQVKSIDEVAIKLSPLDQNQKKSLYFAQNIKTLIKSRIGSFIRASVGISANSFLAKLAAESKKPDGLTMLKLENLQTFYATQKLTDLCGINWRMQAQLNQLGIYTPLDFFHIDLETLKQYFGKIGQYWYLRLHGYDALDNSNFAPPKSISQSHVLEPRCRRWSLAWAVCQKLFFKAARRLRRENMATKKITLFIKTLDRNYQKQYLRTEPIADSFTLTRYFKVLWDQIVKVNNLPIKIAIVFSNLVKGSFCQQQLFANPDKEQNLSRTLDKIHRSFGSNKVIPVNVFQTLDSAPDRISFGQPKF